MRRLLAVLLCLAPMGCGLPLGLNFQRSSLRSGGDLTATTTLEFAPAEHLEQQRGEIVKYALALIKLLDTGQLSSLPLSEVEKKLKDVVPTEFHLIVDAALGYVAAQHIDVQGIGKDNVKRIRAFLVGTVRGADAYDLKDRDAS